MGQCIAVLSGKGGTGKTSVCAGIATALAQSGKKVLCIDCDIGLRNLDISLGLSYGCALSFLDISEGGYPLSQASVHPGYPSLSFLTAPMNCPADRVRPEAFQDMMKEARERFDYIFLDAPAGLDAGFRLTAAAADRAIVVTGSGPASMRDAARVGELLELMGKDQVRIIVNRVDPELLSTLRMTIDDVMDTTGLPLLGVIPEDAHMTLAAAFGKPLLLYSKRCAAAKAFCRIADRVQGLYRPIPL